MFLSYMQVEAYQNVLKMRCSPPAFTLYKDCFFKKGAVTIWTYSFSAWFSKKIFLTLCFINKSNFFVWLSLCLEKLGNVCIVIICCPFCEVINLEINVSFLTKPLFYITKKSGQKCKYLKNKQRAFNMKWKAFLVAFKGLSVFRNCPRPLTEPQNRKSVSLLTSQKS